MSTEKTTVAIMSTTDYDQFKLMGGNRLIDNNHVEKLRSAMIENPDWFKTKPGVVNSENYIIDGQHRLNAAKKAGLPFYYVIGEKMNLGAAREMNIRQKQWTFRDYAESYANAGNENYENLIRLMHKFPALNLSTLAEICANSTAQRGGFTQDFKNGLFVIKDLSDAMDRVEYFNQVVQKANRRATSSFVQVMLTLLRNDDFNRDHFLKRLEMGAELIPAQLSRDNYRNIEDVYNYHISEGNRVRFY